MFIKAHGMIALDLSDTQDVCSVQMGSVLLDCTFAEPLAESIVLISINQFSTYWEITPEGSVLLDLAL